MIAIASLLAARFGRGGGDEARRAQFLSGLDGPPRQARRAATRSTTCAGRTTTRPPSRSTSKFKLGGDGEGTSGNVIIDAGSLDTSGASSAAASQACRRVEQRAARRQPSARRPATRCSWPARRSATAIPGLLFEYDVHGGGIDARGASFPGSGPYVELGRGPDYSWSATSSGTRHHRPLRRDALRRQRHEVRVQGRLPRHDGRSMPARSVPAAGQPARPGRLQGDRPRPGDRLRDRRRPACRGLLGPLDARTRDGQLARFRGLQHGRRIRRAASSTPPRRSSCRSTGSTPTRTTSRCSRAAAYRFATAA